MSLAFSRFSVAGRQMLRPLAAGSQRFGHSGAADNLLKVPETKISKLGNGVRVASENTNTETASVEVFIDSGSRFEGQKAGLAHFLEHLAFKGTQSRTLQALESEIESIGGRLSAQSGREFISFSAQVLKKDVARAVEILADAVQNPVFPQDEVEKQRAQILKEVEDSESRVEENVVEILHATAFQGGDLSKSIYGSAESIKSITRDDLSAFVKKSFTGPRVIVSAAGGVEHEEFAKLVDKSFSRISAESSPKESKQSRFFGSEVRVRNDEYPTAHMALAFEGASITSPDVVPLMVAQNIIGSWDISLGGAASMSSKLAQKVEHYHVANSFNTFNHSYSDTGLFGVYVVSAEKTKLDDLIYLVQQELVRISVNANEAEVQRAKNQLKANLFFRRDGNSSISSEIGKDLLFYGRRLTPLEWSKRIDSIDAKTVRDVCYKYLYDKDPAFVGYGPIEAMPDYNRVNVATSWLRI